MIDIIEKMKQSYDISTTQVDKIIVDGKEYRITNVQYDDDCYEEGNIFGTAIARTLEFEIENVVNLEKKEFEYLTGIYINNEVNWISLGNFITQDVNPNDTTNISKVISMDYMLKSNIEYKSNLKYNNTVMLDVAEEACQQAGIILATKNFTNYNFKVDSNQFAEKTLIRQVIQAIAQISGTVAKIKNDNKLYFINPCNIKTISKVFTLNNYEEAEIKRATQPINVVTIGMKDINGENITLRDEESISKYGEHSLIINDNPFAYTQQKREQLITALFNAVKGFDYKSYTFKCQCLPYLETMDKIQFKDKANNTYDSYIFRFNYKSPKGLESTIEAPSIIRATIEYQNIPDALDIAKRTEIMVDKQNQKIEAVVSNVDAQNQKISNVTQTVDEIRSHISEIADLTTSAESFGSLTLERINESEPIRIVVRPVGEDISYLYPSDDLFPSNNLYLPNRKLRFATEGYSADWEIPDDLLYYDAEYYDELILDYEGQSCSINKRVGFDAEGNKKPLETMKTVDYPYPTIKLIEGDYTITVLDYPTAYIFARLMTQNIYTTQFATKAEMNSAIIQTKSEIDLNVNKKLTNYSTTVEMNSAINLKSDFILNTVSNTLKSYSTTVQMKSAIEQKADSINLELTKKVNNSDYTSAQIMLKINNDTSEAKIDADKINITSNDILNLIAKNTIDLTSKEITLTSNAFKVNKNGQVEIIAEENGDPNKAMFSVRNSNNTSYSKLMPSLLWTNSSYGMARFGVFGWPILHMKNSDNGYTATMQIQPTDEPILELKSANTTEIKSSGITTPTLTQTSLSVKKKNIEKIDIKATELIKNADICLYNLKGKKENKKHIGLVIGDDYNCPNEIISEDGQGVEQYSMTSLAWKAIQELVTRLEKLEGK